MSLPSTLNTQDENFFSLENLFSDPDLLYLYSLKDTDGISDKSISLNTVEASLTTPLDAYNCTINFEKDIYQKIRNESNDMIENKSFNISKGIRNSMNEFHLRSSIQLASTLTEKIYNPFALSSDLGANYEEIKELALSNMLFDKLPGINPKKWPLDLDKLLQKLEDLPLFSLFNEPLEYHQDFFTKADEYMNSCITSLNSSTFNKDRKPDQLENLILSSKIMILINLLSGQFPNYLKNVQLIKTITENLCEESQKSDYLNKLSTFMLAHINKIRLMAETTPRLHYARNLCDEGGFKIAKVAHFQKQTFLTTSFTTDGTYLYLYVSATNGGMYKIGTGEKDTVAGKIYLFAAVSRQEEVAWVYCKGKLYLRSNSKEFGSIDIICPNTFKFEGMIQLYCPEVFGHPSLQIINKNYPLLSDGEYLYVIGKKLISEKIMTVEEEEEKRKESEHLLNISNMPEANKSLPVIISNPEQVSSKEIPMEEEKNSQEPPKELVQEQQPQDLQVEKSKEIQEQQPNQSEQPQELKPQEEQPNEQKPEQEKKVEENKLEEKMPEEIKQDKPEEIKQEDKKPEENIVEEKKPEQSQNQEKKLEELQIQEKKPEELLNQEKKPEENKVEENKVEEIKVEEKKPEQLQNQEKEPEEIKIPEQNAEANKLKGLSQDPSIENNIMNPKEFPVSNEINPADFIPPEQIWDQLAVGKNESRPLDIMELEPDFLLKEKLDPKIVKEIMEKSSEINKGDIAVKAKSGLFNKKMEKEKIEKPVAVVKREENKKKKDKKVAELLDSEHTLKLCEFILYEFDLSNPLGSDCFNETNMSNDKELIQELYESFNGFYSYNECSRALSFNKDDIANAAQWLVDEGEKERTKKTILVKSSTLLAQAEVVSDISNKNLKNNAEIITKDESIIFPMNVSANIWTMNQDQVTLYSETGIKIFSKDPKDVKPLVFKKISNPNNPVIDPLNPIENPVEKKNFFSGFNEDFFKRNKNLANEGSNNELIDNLLEHEDFFVRYSRIIKPEEEGLKVKDNPFLNSSNKDSYISNSNVPPWIKSNANLALFQEPIKEPMKEILPESSILQKESAIIQKETSIKEPPESLKQTILSKIPKKLVLKGSHIKTIESSKKGFHPHPNFHMCYDPYMKKYYVMNWAWNSYTNIFPSLVTIAYDYENYEEREFLIPLHGLRDLKGSCYLPTVSLDVSKSGSPQKNEELECSINSKKQPRFGDILEGINDILVRLMRLQRRRFSMPWILNNWEYTYGYGLVEVMNRKAIVASLKDIEPEKKKLNSQKGKLLSRLNKFISFKENKKIENLTLLEIKKRYAGCIDGSYETYNLILQFCVNDLTILKNLKEFNENMMSNKQLEYLYLVLQYLLLWVKHSDILAVNPKQQNLSFSSFEKLAYEILKNPEIYHSQPDDSPFRKIFSLLWRVIIQGFEIFVRENTRQTLWLEVIFSYSTLSNPIFKYSRKHESIENLCYEISDFDEFDFNPLSYFFMKFAKWNESILPDYPLKESLIEGLKPEDDINKKFDSNTNFFNVYRKFRTLKVKEKSFVEPFGRLFIEDLTFLYHLKSSNNLFEEYYPNYFINNENASDVKGPTKDIKEPSKDNKEPSKDNKEPNENKAFTTLIIDGKTIDMSDFNPKILIPNKKLSDHQEFSKKLWDLFESKLKKALETPSIDGILIFKIFHNLFLDSYLEISRIEDGFFEAFYQTKLTRKFLDVFERVLDHGLHNLLKLSNATYISKIIGSIILILNSVFPLIHQSNMIKFTTMDSNLIKKLINILEILSQYTSIVSKNDQKLNLLVDMFTISNEGIDQINEKVFETNHPYERGKVVSFDQYHFPGALAISVELDKRCQSDTSNDYLIAAGWYNHHTTNMALQMSPRDGVGTCYRISGKPNMKRPLVLLGNTIQVEFSSSGHAKDEQSLNRWGFKVIAKGIYGAFHKKLWPQRIENNEINEIISKFGGEKSLSDWFNGLRILVLLISESIEKNLRGSRLNQKEIENSTYLKWSLMKKGLNSVNPDLFIQDILMESRSLSYKDSNNETSLTDILGVSEDFLDLENQNLKIKTLLKQNPDLQLELKEDFFSILRSDLRSRILKDRILLPEGIRKRLDEDKAVKQNLLEILPCDPQIKACLEEIKLKKGQFYEIISQIKSLYPEPNNLRSEKMRPRFIAELKNQWDYAENLIILSFLYHNGSLGIKVNANNLQYFKEQLAIIGTKKNQILEWMIGQVQNEREWQFAVQELEEIQKTYLEKREALKKPEEEKKKAEEPVKKPELPLPSSKNKKKKGKKEEERKQLEEKQEESKKEEPTKRPEIDEKLENDLWHAFQDRYSNNFDSIRNLCLLKNIPFNEEDPNIGLKEFFSICKQTLMTFKQGSPVAFESPYHIIAETLINKCLFLLKLGTYYTFLSKDGPQNQTEDINNQPSTPLINKHSTIEGSNQLSPPGLGRSISCQVEEKIDKDKLENFRSWIDSYQKWKVWQAKSESQEADLVNENHSSYHSIGSFLCSKVKIEDLEFCLYKQNHRCAKRIQGLRLLNELYDRVQGTLLEKYVLGIQTELFRYDCLRNIKCASKELKELFNEPFLNNLRVLMKNFNKKFMKMEKISLNELTVEINKVKMGGKFSELDNTIKEYLRVLYLNLVEISSIISTHLNVNYLDLWLDDQSLGEEFFKNIMKLSLFCRSLGFLSPNFEDLTLLTQNLNQLIWLLCCRIIENIREIRSVSKILTIILTLIGKEYGLYEGKNLINLRVLPRLTDLATNHRLEGLLSLLYNLFLTHENMLNKKNLLSETINKYASILYQLLYFLNQPSLVRLLLKSLQPITAMIHLESLPSVYEMNYFTKLALNYDDLSKNTKAQNIHQLINPMMLVKELMLEKPQIHLPLNNLTLIIEKIGQAILTQEDPKSLRNVLDIEISRITKDLDYSKSLAHNLAHNYSISSENTMQDQFSFHQSNNPPLSSMKGSQQCSSTSSLKSASESINLKASKEPSKNKDTVVLIQLSNEEDISFLVTVFYYWEELYPSFSLKYPKSLDEFYRQKEEKLKRENEQKLTSIANSQSIEKCPIPPPANNIPQPTLSSMYSHKIFEKLILNQPDFNLLEEEESELPFGWYLNYMGIFPDMKCPKPKSKQGKSKKCVKKVWANTNLLKLERKYESLIKTFEEIKETDSFEDKLQTLMARNYIARMMHHIKDVKNIATMLNVFGFAPALIMAMPQKRATELGYIIHLGINNLLKPINLEQFKEDIRKKLDPVVVVTAPPQNPPQNPPIQPQRSNTRILEAALNAPKSQMVISMCDQAIYQNFDFTIDFVTSLTANKDNFYTDCNKFSIVHRAAKSGSSNCSLIHELIEYLRFSAESNPIIKSLLQKYLEEMVETLSREDRWGLLSQFDKNVYVGLCNIIGGWTQTLRSGALTSIKNLDRDNLCIVTQGGYTSGKKNCNIISKNDPSLLVQTVNADQLELRFMNEWEKKGFELNYAGLLESIRHCFNSFRKSKNNKSDEIISISIILRSLLQIAISADWNILISSFNLSKDLLQTLMTFLHELCQNCPVDKSYTYHEYAFANAWEKLVDKLDPSNQLFSIPQSFEPSQSYEFELEQKKILVSKPSERNSAEVENSLNYVLPSSTYVDSLPEHQQTVSEHKMLKYWEKHIIPRIQDFVRSSLKPWEFEDFFEQLRQPLRKGDQAKAAEVAYILCDQRLPAGVVLPDVNHDWNTITIEEVQIGQWAIAKIHGTNNQLFSQFFTSQYRLGNTELCVQMLAVDAKSSSVLVMYQDHENLQLISIWLPVFCLKLPEIPLTPHVACLEYDSIIEEFLRCMNNSISLLSRQVLLKFFSIEGFSKTVDLQKEEKLLKQFNLPLTEIIRWSVLEELSEDPVEGWLEANELNYIDSNPFNANQPNFINLQAILQNKKDNKSLKLNEIQVFLNWLVQNNDGNNNEHIDNLMVWLKTTFPAICDYISISGNYINLYKSSIENSNNPFSLNTFSLPQHLNDSISALCVSFKQDATLCLCSGLKFYSDEYGINIIHHIQAGKEAKTKLKPLMFKMSNVWCSYYYNSEALPPYLQNQAATTLPALISGIPSSWSVCCWLLDSLSTSFMLSSKKQSRDFLVELVKILIQGLEKLKSPVMLRELLSKLLIRTIRKIHHVLYETPQYYFNEEIWKGPESNKIFFELQGVNPEFVGNLIDEVVKLRENQSVELYILHSSYIQQLMELVITVLLPYIQHSELIKSISGLLPEKANNLPEGFIPLFNVMTICNYIRGEGQLSKDLSKECMDNIKLETQWDRLIYIENLPQQWTPEYIITSLSDIITKNKGRVLLPSLDLYLPMDPKTNKHKGVCIILLDGWAVMDIEEVVSTEKKEEPPVEVIPQEELIEEQKDIIPEEKLWTCEICTLENPDELNICSICEAPRPAKKQPVVSEKEIAAQMKRADLSEVEKEIQKKDQLRFEKFLQDINSFVQKYYDDKAQEKEKEKNEENKAVAVEEVKKPVEEVKLTPQELNHKRNKDAKEKKKQEKLLKKQEIEKNKQLRKQQKKTKKKQHEEENEEESGDEEVKQPILPENQPIANKPLENQPLIENKPIENKPLIENKPAENQPPIENKPVENQAPIENKQVEIQPPIENKPVENNDIKPIENDNKLIEENKSNIIEEKPINKIDVLSNLPLELKEENNKELMKEELKENENVINNSNSPLIKKIVNEDNMIMSPEFSKGVAPEEFPPPKKCLVLFGAHIFENKTANVYLKEMLIERAINENTTFKPNILKLLKSIYIEILVKHWEKGLKEKLGKSASFINMSSFENFSTEILAHTLHNPFDFWKILEFLGFDFWGCNAGFHCLERPQLISLRLLSDLMKYIEIELCQETKAVLTFSALNIRLMNKSPLQESSEKVQPINYFNEITLESKYYQLYRYSIKDLRYAWSLLKIFNANLIPTMSFVNMKTNDYSFDHIWLSLSAYLSCLRELWMMPIKRELSHKVLQKTAVNREEVPKVILERLKLNKESNKPVPKSGISLKNKDDFIFTKSFEQLKDISTTLLRPLKPQGAEPHISFEVIFKGENVMGEAGPYRQYFADISMELQPSALNPYSITKNLNLLCPSPNNDAKLGKGRDKFVINPSAKSSYHLQLFEFLGILMGCSVRTGTHLTLDLPLLFWKQLVGQKVDFEDLEEVDESLKDLLNIFQNYSKAQFEETIMETFSTTLSNKTVVELKKGGSKIPVLYEDRYDYVHRVLQARMKESMLQIEAIKKGLTILIPLPFLNGISAKDLEIWVSGKPKVNIDLLKRHTRYAGELNEESRRVKFLWEVLSGLKENEKLRFVKFCWGQERLPANDEEFERTQTRFMVKPANYASNNLDKALPRADTCFFNLELPDYSTKEILKERFILAINTDCDSMNAEDPKNLDNNVNPNNDRDESSYDQEEEN